MSGLRTSRDWTAKAARVELYTVFDEGDTTSTVHGDQCVCVCVCEERKQGRGKVTAAAAPTCMEAVQEEGGSVSLSVRPE